ncbi:MAG: type II secretion system protein [bacterium]
MKAPRSSAGYTLVELLVTMGLIAIFMTIFIAVVSGTMKTLRTVENRTDMTQKAWAAMSYLKARVSETNFFDTSADGLSTLHYVGHDQLGRSGGTVPRADVDPDYPYCDIAPTPLDRRITGGTDLFTGNRTGDFLDPNGTVPGGLQAQVLEDPQCYGLDPDLEFRGNAGALVCPPPMLLNPCPPDSNINPDDRNTHLIDTGAIAGFKRYRMDWEDLDASGNFLTPGGLVDQAESHLRTLIYSTRSPTAASYLESSCPSSTSRVERDVVTVAHTWKEKTFWIDDLGYGPGIGRADYGTNAPGAPNELRTFDFVLYERRTRFYEDANRNLDLDCNQQLNWVYTQPRYDERFRTLETPIASGIVDVQFKLLNADDNEILPCTNTDTAQSTGTCNILRSILPAYLVGRDPTPIGLFYTNCYLTIPSPGGTRYPRACSRLGDIRAIEITVVAGSNDVLTLLRKSRDINGKIFGNLTNLDPRQIGAVDYLGVTPQKILYNPGSLVTMKEKVYLPGYSLGR